MARGSGPEYPVGTPFRAPQESHAQVARLRRWTLGLLGAAALALLATVAAGVFWFNVTAHAEDPTPEDDDAKPASAKPADARVDRVMGALGGLSVAHLYQSFLNIGLLADSVEADVYTREEAEKMLTTMLDQMDQVDRHLRTLKTAGFDKEDQQDVEQVQKVSRALRAQAGALRSYWETNSREDQSRYHAARDEARADLRELMKKE